jgi:hypothetical protein
MVSLSNHEVRAHSVGRKLPATPSWFDKLTMRATDRVGVIDPSNVQLAPAISYRED